MEAHLFGPSGKIGQVGAQNAIEELAAGFGRPSEWHVRRAMPADIRDALAGLPDELRSLADVLDACDGNLREAARSLGLSRKEARIMLKRLQDSLAWLRHE